MVRGGKDKDFTIYQIPSWNKNALFKSPWINITKSWLSFMFFQFCNCSALINLCLFGFGRQTR